MDHGYFIDRISAYLDGELPDYEQQAVGEHLLQCDECSRLFNRLKKADVLVEKYSDVDGDDYFERMASKIEQQIGVEADEPEITPVPKRRTGLGWKITAAAASIAVLMFIGINYTDIMQQAEPEVESPSPVVNAPEIADDEAVRKSAAPEGSVAGVVAEPKDTDKSQVPEDRAKPEQTTAVEKDTDLKEGAGSRGTIARQEIEVSQSTPDVQGAVSPESPSPDPEKLKAEQLYEDIVAETDIHLDRNSIAREQQDAVISENYQPAAQFSVPLQGIVQGVRAKPDLSLRGAVNRASSAGGLGFEATSSGEGQEQASMAEWVQRADSLEDVWSTLMSDRGRLALGKSRSSAKLIDRSTVERQLVEVKYEVGQRAVGTDWEQFNRSMQFFREYLSRRDILHRDRAMTMIDHLSELEARESAESGQDK